MSTVAQDIGAIQRKCGMPSAPGFGIIGEFHVETIDTKVTELNLSREPRLISRCNINVQPNLAVYSLNALAPSFDRARYLYTADSSNPTFRRRPVEIVQPESLDDYSLGGNALAYPNEWTANQHSASAAAVYHDSRRGWMIEFVPIPQRVAQYVLVFEIRTKRLTNAGSSSFAFDQFSTYLTDCTALRILSHCEWDGMEPALWPEKRRELAGNPALGYGLVVEVAKGDKLFWKWKHSGKNASTGRNLPWAFGRW